MVRYPSGLRGTAGTFKNGHPVGEWKTWNAKGVLTHRWSYGDGWPVLEDKTFRDDGTLDTWRRIKVGSLPKSDIQGCYIRPGEYLLKEQFDSSGKKMYRAWFFREDSDGSRPWEPRLGEHGKAGIERQWDSKGRLVESHCFNAEPKVNISN